MVEFAFHFPPGFLWGTATSSHQVEGDNTNNDWWRWEQEPGLIRDGSRSGRACDWWRNAEADFDRAAAMGQNAHRLSIEWSRIEPREDIFDDAALDRYREMLRGLREREIEPMVTLHHFTNPLWLAEQGGWENPLTIERFERYVRHAMNALKDLCRLWCTINEPNILAYMGWNEGKWPPGKRDFGLYMQVLRHLMRAHARAYHAIHELQPEAQVGIAHNMVIFEPAHPAFPLDRMIARLHDRMFNGFVLDAMDTGREPGLASFRTFSALRGTYDFIGLNYYTRRLSTFDRRSPATLFSRTFLNPHGEISDGEYGEVFPEGLYQLLKRLARYGKPIYVTENGIPDADDDQRPRFLVRHLHAMWRAIQHNVPVRGYFHWSLVDNFEWAEGWTLRFGLIEVDPETQARRPRRSADLYAEVCRANALTSEAIIRHTPELLKEMFGLSSE
jgi:beta-glucosidase